MAWPLSEPSWPYRSTSVAYEDYREMLHPAAERLPSGVKVVVLADRGFVHTNAMVGWAENRLRGRLKRGEGVAHYARRRTIIRIMAILTMASECSGSGS